MPSVFTYGRASTDKQVITLLSQEQVCRAYFELRKARDSRMDFAGWFPDAAITSKIDWFERPMGEKIFRQLKKDDLIVVSNFDRAFRSVGDCDRTLNLQNEMGFHLVIMDLEIDTSTPLGKCFAVIVSAIKRLEREECSRRTKVALQYNLLHGKPHASRDPIGWSRIKGGKLKPNITDRQWSKEVIRLYEERGYDFREIEIVFRKRGAKTPRGNAWHLRRVRLAYSAAKCGFPRLYTPDLPPVMELKKYEAAHGGRPPLLQHGAVAAGLLHTLPPMMDLLPDAEIPDDV